MNFYPVELQSQKRHLRHRAPLMETHQVVVRDQKPTQSTNFDNYELKHQKRRLRHQAPRETHQVVVMDQSASKAKKILPILGGAIGLVILGSFIAKKSFTKKNKVVTSKKQGLLSKLKGVTLPAGAALLKSRPNKKTSTSIPAAETTEFLKTKQQGLGQKIFRLAKKGAVAYATKSLLNKASSKENEIESTSTSTTVSDSEDQPVRGVSSRIRGVATKAAIPAAAGLVWKGMKGKKGEDVSVSETETTTETTVSVEEDEGIVKKGTKKAAAAWAMSHIGNGTKNKKVQKKVHTKKITKH